VVRVQFPESRAATSRIGFYQRPLRTLQQLERNLIPSIGGSIAGLEHAQYEYKGGQYGYDDQAIRRASASQFRYT